MEPPCGDPASQTLWTGLQAMIGEPQVGPSPRYTGSKRTAPTSVWERRPRSSREQRHDAAPRESRRDTLNRDPTRGRRIPQPRLADKRRHSTYCWVAEASQEKLTISLPASGTGRAGCGCRSRRTENEREVDLSARSRGKVTEPDDQTGPNGLRDQVDREIPAFPAGVGRPVKRKVDP